MNEPLSSPLNFSVDTALDLAAIRGWEAWLNAARKRGARRTADWMRVHVPEEIPDYDVDQLVETLLEQGEPEGTVIAAAELAEIIEAEDPEIAMLLWEGVMLGGQQASDGELVFEGASRMAAIEEKEFGDSLAAAEDFIEFLNWRRQDEHSSDADSVLTAFDEIIRFAEADGARKEAALFSRAQAKYFAIEETGDPRLTTGDWDESVGPYTSWD
jgi:hypothetical protein